MTRFRFSIAGLMGAVALLGLVFAALRAESEVWSGLLFTLIAFVLLIAIVGVVCSRGDARAFWVGVAVVGWGYWLVAYAPAVETSTGYVMPVSSSSLFDGFTQYLHPKLQRTDPTPSVSAGGVRTVGPSEAAVWRTCHSLLTLVLALIGGVIGRVFYLARKDACDAGGNT